MPLSHYDAMCARVPERAHEIRKFFNNQLLPFGNGITYAAYIDHIRMLFDLDKNYPDIHSKSLLTHKLNSEDPVDFYFYKLPYPSTNKFVDQTIAIGKELYQFGCRTIFLYNHAICKSCALAVPSIRLIESPHTSELISNASDIRLLFEFCCRNFENISSELLKQNKIPSEYIPS
jgi:hypothetical protein